MSDSRPNFMAELKAMFRQGREDFLNALQHPMPDSMHLTREPGAPDTPTPQTVTRELDGDFRSVLAEYSARGQGREQAERGHDMER